MKNEQYNFTIIIPHKNIPHLLKRCISSIPYRDDLQIIIVDDSSSPDIVDFNDFPGEGRLNTSIIYDKTGLFAGHARNIALDYARGKWVIFADADDFFNYCFNEVLEEFKDDESDMIFFKANSLDSDYYTSSNRADDRLNYYIDHFEFDKDKYANLLKYKCGEPWAKFIKKSIIDKYNIKFDEIVIHNDHKFSYTLGRQIKSIKIDKRAIYCVTTRNGSVQTNTSDESYLTRIRVFGEAEMFFKENNLPFYVYWDRHFFQMGSLYYNKKDLYHKGFNELKSLGFSEGEIKYRTYLYSYKSQIGCIYKSLLRKCLAFFGIYKYNL